MIDCAGGESAESVSVNECDAFCDLPGGDPLRDLLEYHFRSVGVSALRRHSRTHLREMALFTFQFDLDGMVP